MREQDVFLQQALLESGAVTTAELEAARREASERDVSVTEALLRSEAVDAKTLALVRADLCEAPFVDLIDYEICFANTRLIPRTIAERYMIFPLFLIDGVLTVAMEDPLNLEAVDQVRQIAKRDVETVLCQRDQLQALIARAYSLSYSSRDARRIQTPQADQAEDSDAAQPVVAAVNQILSDAAEARASDVHINPDEHDLHIRFRIDGVLQSRQGPPLSMHSGLVQRLKVMANLDLTQTRRPQDGKFRLRHHGASIDIRMSTLPTVCGENVVLRLLANNQAIHDFHELGVPPLVATELEDLLVQPRNIMTIEDPVEIRLPYVRQIQVHSEIGLTFASALRAILRQDPDVVLVGEVRDNETATIALQAALTGHMVLSTLHTNDAPGAVSRLRDYGLPPFVINSAVLGVLAQRLVRRVCSHCTGPAQLDDLVRRRFRIETDATGFVQGRGCARCGQSGFRGRVGLYELLRFETVIQRLVEEGQSVDRIREAAVARGMRLMWQDGLEKARLGQTTLGEVAKAVSVLEVDDLVHMEEAASLSA
ncbi:MAG: GspE/PulE family protein [Planctomycetota bacterium]|jgi:type IV pilus assembly protein PilB